MEIGALWARSVSVEKTYVSVLAVVWHSAKGMSCTDTNTLLSVVLGGEITVKKWWKKLWLTSLYQVSCPE